MAEGAGWEAQPASERAKARAGLLTTQASLPGIRKPQPVVEYLRQEKVNARCALTRKKRQECRAGLPHVSKAGGRRGRDLP